MDDTRVDSNAAILSERATGYSPGPNGPVNAEFIHMSLPHGAGALYSTTVDLLRWDRALHGGEVLSEQPLPIFAESEDRFFLRVVPVDLVPERSDAGDVVAITIFQAGKEVRAARTE